MNGNSSEIGSRILWKRAEVKAMFQVYGLWPSFIGVTIDPHREVKTGLMPVILSQEQNRYMEAKKGNPLVNRKSSRKRKITDISSDDVAPDAVAASSLNVGKRQRISSYLESFFRAMFNIPRSLSSVFQSSVRKSESKATTDSISQEFEEDSSDVKEEIFPELKRKGYFVGPGGNYGGDYTLYVGRSPADSHSTATVRIIDDENACMPLRDLVALSRVQTQVNKTAVLAFTKISKNDDMSFPSKVFDHLSDATTDQKQNALDNRKNLSTNHKNQSLKDLDTSQVRFLKLNFKDVSRRL